MAGRPAKEKKRNLNAQAILLKLEDDARVVESDIDNTIAYAVRRDRQGIHIVQIEEGNVNDIPIHKDMIPILREAIMVYEYLKDGVDVSELHKYKRVVRVG